MRSVPFTSSTSYRLVAEIDLDAVRWNVRQVLSLVGPGTGMMAVVKADGYGHGAEEVARAALGADATWLGVATPAEGMSLREALPDAPICVFTPFLPDEAEDLAASRLTPFVSDLAGLLALQQAAEGLGKVVPFHLEVDTGMGRSGAAPETALALADAANRMPGVEMTGIATHFASAEDDPGFTLQQTTLFDSTRTQISGGHDTRFIHASNSAATILCPAARYSLVRPGLLLYGLLPTLPKGTQAPAVKPVMTLRTRIALIRELPKGHGVSYNRTRILDRPTRVATLPVGYGDGYPRALSNKGDVLVGGKRAPILGRVCMDLTMVDVTEIPAAETGSEVVLIGRQGDEHIRAEELARMIGTTEHEITTRLTARVPRVNRDR